MYKRYLALIITITFALQAWSIPAADPDLGMHLFGGAWILEHMKLPGYDPINTFNLGWHDYHWLGQIIIYKVYQTFSFQGLEIFLGIINLLIALILFRIAETKTKNYFAISLCSIISIYLIQSVSSVRPQMFAFLAIAYAAYILNKKHSKFEFIQLFLLSVITANLHVYWILIPALYFCHRSLRNYKFSLIYNLILGLAGLISPYSFTNYAVVLDYLSMSDLMKSYLSEMHSAFGATKYLTMILLGLFAILLIYTPWKKWKILSSRNLPTFSIFFLSINSIRYISILGITIMAILPQLLSKLIRDLKISPKIITSTLIICAVFSSYNAIKSFPSSNTHMQLKSELIPFKACKKVSELNLSPRHGRDHIRILTHFNHGNWCRWLAYEQQPLFDLRVTTDSRTQWVADEQYTKSFNAYLLKPGWLETLNTWSPDVALLYKSAALAQMMILAKDDWQIVHEDENFALFIPRH